MTDQFLPALLRACDTLDANPTKERVTSIRKLCAVLADAYLCKIRANLSAADFDDRWLDDANFDESGAPLDMVICYHLALNTCCWIDSTDHESLTSEWARKHRARTVSDWVKARRRADEFAFGEVRAATQIALDRAERRAAGLVAGVAAVAMRKDAEPRVESPSPVQAWSFD
jgi:hypothetical protein